MKQENMVGNLNYLIGHQASQIFKEQAPHAKIQMKHQDIGWKLKKGDYLYSIYF